MVQRKQMRIVWMHWAEALYFCLTGTVESADHSQHRLAESRGKYFSVCGSGNRGRFERTAAGIAGGRSRAEMA